MSPECLPFPFALPRRICAHAWPPLAHGLRSRSRSRMAFRTDLGAFRFGIGTESQRDAQTHRFLRRNDACLGKPVESTRKAPLAIRHFADVLPFCSTERHQQVVQVTQEPGKNVAPSFSPPDRTAMGARQAVISAPGPHWHAADRILHASVHAGSPSTCTKHRQPAKAPSTCPEPRPDTSMTACHGANIPWQTQSRHMSGCSLLQASSTCRRRQTSDACGH